MPQLKTEIDANTIPIPETSVEDFASQTALNISTLLTHPPISTALVFKLGDTTKNGLLQLTSLLHRSSTTGKIVISNKISS